MYSNPIDTEAIARTVDDSGGLCFVPCFDGIQAPYNDSKSASSLIGLTHSTSQAHILRAMNESFGFVCKQLFDVAREEVKHKITSINVDGGVFSNNFVSQFTADLLQFPVRRPAELNKTVFGAVYVAGLASGFWRSRDEIRGFWKLDKEFLPETYKENIRDNNKCYKTWQSALERSLDWYR